MTTVMSPGAITLPAALRWIPLDVAVAVLGGADLGWLALGGRLFRRELLVPFL